MGIEKTESKFRKVWIFASIAGMAIMFGGFFFTPEKTDSRFYAVVTGLVLLAVGMVSGWVHTLLEKEIENRGA